MEFFANFDKLKNIWFIKKKSLGKEWSEQRDKVVLDAIHTKQKENEGKVMDKIGEAAAKTTIGLKQVEKENERLDALDKKLGATSVTRKEVKLDGSGEIKAKVNPKLSKKDQDKIRKEILKEG